MYGANLTDLVVYFSSCREPTGLLTYCRRLGCSSILLSSLKITLDHFISSQANRCLHQSNLFFFLLAIQKVFWAAIHPKSDCLFKLSFTVDLDTLSKPKFDLSSTELKKGLDFDARDKSRSCRSVSFRGLPLRILSLTSQPSFVFLPMFCTAHFDTP